MKEIIKIINGLSNGYEVFGVGGFSRDLILGLKHKDIDLAVNKDAHKFAKKVAKALNSKLVVLDDKDKVYRIIIKDAGISNIDISLFDGKNIGEDLKNRDYTVNATAFELKFFDGFKKHMIYAGKDCVKDLKSKRLNVVSPGVFKKDPLRMLRAFRFAAELGLKIADETYKHIKKAAKLIKKAAPERIKNEFFRILTAKNSSVLLKEMDKCGLLAEIFPEVKSMKKAAKKYYYHPGGLFQHSFETMEACEDILNNLKKYFPDNCTELQKHFEEGEIYSENVTRCNILKFAALFHDSAKPETAKKEGGKMRFFGHEEAGAKKTEKIIRALKMSKKDTAGAKFLIENHMRPSTLTRNNTVTQKASLKFFRDVADNTPDLLVLSMADWHSYKKLKIFSQKELKAQERSVRKLVKYYYEIKNAKPLPKLVDGNVLMKEFKLKPGPWLGELIETVLAAQQEGKVCDKKGALALVSANLKAVKKKYKI